MGLARMANARRGFLLVALLVVVALGLLVFKAWPTSPHGGLSQPAAIQIAWAHVDPGATRVVSADVRRSFHTGFNIPAHEQAWVITFTGQWHLLCNGGCDPTTEWVAVDYYTGEWIASQYSYRAQ
jgi:hypothetical protein